MSHVETANRLALQSQIIGGAALGSEGVLCVRGDPVDGVSHVNVKDLSTTALIANAKDWAAPRTLAIGAVVNPFAPDLERELRLLERKLTAGADFVQSQMIFDLNGLRAFLDRAADVLTRDDGQSSLLAPQRARRGSACRSAGGRRRRRTPRRAARSSG
jgi:5,10-methylenetetrahydrofolate reductase